MNVISGPHPVGPPCPACQSTNTIKTHEQTGESMFFCADCEHSWWHRPGKPPKPKLR